ncbi:MAG: hypothetical protein QOJ35_2452 [Solirubrobacteraceae bacterium]|nr:hypothetical protein [Solirubrobacteraceae bacterium]
MPAAARAIACCVAVAVAALLAAAPAAAPASSRAERVVAADAFAARTLTFDRRQRAARARAMRALGGRRRAAQTCLAVWQSAPLWLREDLGLVYFEYLSGALWSVDEPLFRSWIYDVRTSARVGGSPQLARGAEALKGDYAAADRVYRAVPDACATVTRWRDAGWGEAGRPPLFAIVAGLRPGPDALRAKALDAARRQLVRYARHGPAAARVLSVGVDEPDARVDAHIRCDAVGALVLPDAYQPCASGAAGA